MSPNKNLKAKNGQGKPVFVRNYRGVITTVRDIKVTPKVQKIQ